MTYIQRCLQTWTICFSKMHTLLVGDSHVRRFENYVKGSLCNETFNISDLWIFDFCRISGGSIANHAHTRAIIFAVRNTWPQHVIVNLGGNDLDSSEDIKCIISRLVLFASLLKRQFHIRTVVILRFMHRSRTRNIDITSYNSRVDTANQLLIRPTRWYAILEVERLHKQYQKHF